MGVVVVKPLSRKKYVAGNDFAMGYPDRHFIGPRPI